MDQAKIDQAKEVLRLAAEISRTYYKAPLVITYSGGKDSDVMLDLALEALNPEDIEVINSHTTVDAPETVYYIRDKFKWLEAQGIKTTIKMPRYKGQPTSMWKLIVDKGAFPTAMMRFCCHYLKETSTPHRIVAVGVREDESQARKGRDVFIISDKKNAKYMTAEHIREQFESSKKITADLGQTPETPNAYDCKFIEDTKKRRNALVYPIYKFTEKDIWAYIQEKGLTVNPLYSKGYKRVGCIGCPLAGPRHMKREFADYPKYKENYIKAFDRMIEKRRQEGRPLKQAQTGEELMRLWLRENPKQIRIEDLLKDDPR